MDCYEPRKLMTWDDLYWQSQFFCTHSKLYQNKAHTRLQKVCSFKLPSLASRRKYLDVLFLYKSVHAIHNCSSPTSVICFNVPTRITRNMDTFKTKWAKVNIRKYSPILRMQQCLNQLGTDNPNLDNYFRQYGNF